MGCPRYNVGGKKTVMMNVILLLILCCVQGLLSLIIMTLSNCDTRESCWWENREDDCDTSLNILYTETTGF